MTASHGPSRVPGVRRPLHGQGRAAWTTGDKPDPDNPLTTGLPRGDEWAEHVYTPQDGPQDAADGSDGGLDTSAEIERLERSRARAVVQLGEALDRAEKMARQRDEAVAAFQRERARVARVENVLSQLGAGDGFAMVDRIAAALHKALADKPTDAP